MVIKYKDIIIGNQLNALFYAYFNSLPILLNGNRILPFEFFDYRFDLSECFIHNQRNRLNTVEGEILKGIQKKRVYSYLCWILSLSGKIPLSNKIQTIRYLGNKQLEIITYSNQHIKIEYENQLYIFSTDKIKGLDLKERATTYEVLDWVDVHAGTIHDIDIIDRNNTFVKTIYFYPSVRVPSNYSRKNIKKDAIAYSILSKKQLRDENYTDYFVKFIVEQTMKENGVKGKCVGTQRDLITPRYAPIRVSMNRREVRPRNSFGYYFSKKKYNDIVFMEITEEEIIKKFSEEGYDKTYVHELCESLLKKHYEKYTEIYKRIGWSLKQSEAVK